MSAEIGTLIAKLNKEIKSLDDSLHSKKKLVEALQKECTHSMKYDHTNGHTGVDYDKCEWCGVVW